MEGVGGRIEIQACPISSPCKASWICPWSVATLDRLDLAYRFSPPTFFPSRSCVTDAYQSFPACRRFSSPILLAATCFALLSPSFHTVTTILAADAPAAFVGNWALTIPGGGAGWLGIVEKEGNLQGTILWGGGSVLPVDGVRVEGDKLIVAAWGAPGTSGQSPQPANLLQVSLADKKVTNLGDGTPVGNLDGIEPDADGFTLHLRDNSFEFNPFAPQAGLDGEGPNALGMAIVKKKAKEFFYRRYQGFNTLVVIL